MGRHLGYDWKQTIPSVDSKQQYRQRMRSKFWDELSGANVIFDDHGLVSRKIRRSMASIRFRRTWQERPGKVAS